MASRDLGEISDYYLISWVVLYVIFQVYRTLEHLVSAFRIYNIVGLWNIQESLDLNFIELMTSH